MGGVKVTPADKYFSKCVRARAGYCCERCGKQHETNSQGLHASHHHRRGQWGVRFDPMNAEALCYGCHSHYGGTQERMNQVLTDWEQDVLRERKEDIRMAKLYRRTQGKGAISKHYKAELERIERLRELGEVGRIEFEPFM
jgi:hypothetical protein